jgi:hypothetical protein
LDEMLAEIKQSSATWKVCWDFILFVCWLVGIKVSVETSYREAKQGW